MKNIAFKKLLVKITSLIRKKLLFYLVLLFLASTVYYVLHISYLYIDYNCGQKENIEAYLNETSKELVKNSANETELIANIVQWERDYFISPETHSFDTFNSIFERPLRRTPPDAIWSLYLKKASCGELACVFEDMANRTGLTFRHVQMSGFLNPSEMNGNNHAWSEVQLDNSEWVIGDAGFNLTPLEDNQSYFYLQRSLLLGPIYYVENDTYVDNMGLYVPNTQKITIHAIKNGENFSDGLIYVYLHYNGTSKIMGLPYPTNESGMAEVNLGVYEGVSYTIGVINPETTDYAFKDNITLANGSNSTLITLHKWHISKKLISRVVCYILLILLIGEMLVLLDIWQFRPNAYKHFKIRR
jgi:Transglutaminase-like superfamily.